MSERATQKPATMEGVIGRLLASASHCDKRKGVDLGGLLELARGAWQGRFGVLGFAAATRGALAAVCALSGTRSLVRADELGDAFRFALVIPPRYPLSMPHVQFLDPVPFSPHVVHPESLPDPAGLPAELQGYIRQGVGYMCYLKADQWNAARGSLALAVWQVSRILSGRVHGESASLNRAARDYLLRMRAAGDQRIVLGPPLSYPIDLKRPAVAASPNGDIEWEDADAA